ncbi:hypothetical protein [Nocardia sp. NPDC005745]|uniref:hypothetical protein n=1 Tax=Nocardia sp. NPDC005745 TaxID=3157061 RepID=UPI0033DD5DA1
MSHEPAYAVSAPRWPGEPDTVAATRADPSGWRGLGLAAPTAHYARVARSFDTPPVLIVEVARVRQQRVQELAQPRVRQLGFGFDTGHAQDLVLGALRHIGGVREQRALAHTGFAAQDQRPAAPGCHDKKSCACSSSRPTIAAAPDSMSVAPLALRQD